MSRNLFVIVKAENVTTLYNIKHMDYYLLMIISLIIEHFLLCLNHLRTALTLEHYYNSRPLHNAM